MQSTIYFYTVRSTQFRQRNPSSTGCDILTPNRDRPKLPQSCQPPINSSRRDAKHITSDYGRFVWCYKKKRKNVSADEARGIFPSFLFLRPFFLLNHFREKRCPRDPSFFPRERCFPRPIRLSNSDFFRRFQEVRWKRLCRKRLPSSTV